MKVPAAIFVGNNFGKPGVSRHVAEPRSLESPNISTNTLNVCTAIGAVIEFTPAQKGNEIVQPVIALVAETNEG